MSPRQHAAVTRPTQGFIRRQRKVLSLTTTLSQGGSDASNHFVKRTEIDGRPITCQVNPNHTQQPQLSLRWSFL